MAKMARREFVRGSLATGVAASLGAPVRASETGAQVLEDTAPTKGRPNILWIQTDEQRPDSLECHGSSWARTPNLDQLARQGTVFHECHVQSPLCTPSRTSMLMGRYPQETNVLSNAPQFQDGYLHSSDKSFVNLFADAGYRTASIGKWHTPNHPTWQENEDFILFDISGTGKGRVEVADCFSLVPPYSEPEHRVIKREGPSPIIMSGVYPYHDWGATPSSHITDRAIAWLRDASTGDKPFLLRVSHLWPHSPVLVPPPWDKVCAPGDMPYRPLNRQAQAGRAAYDRDLIASVGATELPEAAWRRIMADYYGLCAHVDHEVGRLLRALDSFGLSENTIVAYNADHGKSLGEIGLSEKGCFDREVWRVPFLLACPGLVPEGAHRQDLMELMDFGPTLCALARVTYPSTMRGRDLFASSEPEMVFGVIEAVGRVRAAVRTRKYRFDCTISRDGEPVAPEACDANLIDLENDPLEEANLAHRPDHAAIAADLYQRVQRWLMLQ